MSCGAEEGVELLYTLLGCCEAMRREEGERRDEEGDREGGGRGEIEGERKSVLVKGRREG